MYNKKSIIIFFLVAILLIGGVVYVGIDLFGSKENKNEENKTSANKNVFSFLDFGKKTNTDIANEDTETIAEGDITISQNKKLIRLTSKKISSYNFYEKEEKIPSTTIDGKQDFITIKNKGLNFIDSETGLIYQLPDEAIENTRLSNNTTPLLGKSLIGNNGNSVIYQYNQADGETIDTYIGNISGAIAPYNLKGFFLPKNVKNITLSPKETQFFYTIPTQTGVIGMIQYFETNKKIQPWSSIISEWVSEWSNDNIITMTTQPSSSTDGYSYFLNISDGKFTKILGPEKGLVTKTSPDTYNVLYSKTEGGKPVLYIYNTVSKSSKNLGFITLADKCTWSDSEYIYCAIPNTTGDVEYPDSWYMGETSFTDSLWKIDTKQNIYTNISELTNENIDATELKYRDGSIYFINKNTGNLWKYITI